VTAFALVPAPTPRFYSTRDHALRSDLRAPGILPIATQQDALEIVRPALTCLWRSGADLDYIVGRLGLYLKISLRTILAVLFGLGDASTGRAKLPALFVFHDHARQHSLDVFSEDVELDIDQLAGLKLTKVCVLPRVRDDPNREARREKFGNR
jgi:hypothetical protein